MPRIICDLPNASEEINGVRFAPDGPGGAMRSAVVDEATAAAFLAIPGYRADPDTDEAARERQAESERLAAAADEAATAARAELERAAAERRAAARARAPRSADAGAAADQPPTS